MPKRHVFHPSGNKILWNVQPEVAQKLVADGLAIDVGDGIRLNARGVPWRQRTQITKKRPTPEDGFRYACGWTQVYTSGEVHPAKIDGYKTIYAEDLPVFRTTIREATMVVKTKIIQS